MTFVLNLTFWAFFINLGLAVIVASGRADRPVNRAFLFLNFTCALWLICIWVGNHQTESQALETWVRITTMVALLMPLALFLLTRVTITGRGLLACAGRHWGWLAITAAEVGLCGTHLFIRSVAVPTDPGRIATPEYGPGFLAYVGWYIAACLVTEVQAWRAWKRLAPDVRAELGYIVTGIFLFNFFAVGLAGVLPLIWKDGQSHQLAPLWMVILDVVVAYGISTRRLLGVSSLARRAASYSILTVYLGLLYAAVWVCAKMVFHGFGLRLDWAAQLLAAVVAAISMGTARTFSRRVVERLFVNSGTIDAKEGIDALDAARVGRISPAGIASAALAVFARLAGADAGSVHLFSPPVNRGLDPLVPAGEVSDGVAAAVSRGPVVAALLRRKGDEGLRKEMAALGAALALPIPGPDGTQGVLLLGERLTGKLYDGEAVAALQAMAAHLGMAVTNARLYLEKSRTAIYQSTVLDQLAVGVIAVDAERNISAFNREAVRILAASSALLPPKTFYDLPAPLRRVIEETPDASTLEREVVLGGETGKPLALRVACRRFFDADGAPLGASLTCHDLSPIKLLEQQLIEADRLATLGQFSAVVAHEIRNPLSSIRAFGQLIPERIDDRAFLERFSAIVDTETARIEAFLRQLLTWGRPSQHKREAVSVEEVIEGVVLLYRPELRKRGIALATAWPERRRPVWGEAQKLQQVFSNLILNAVQAMPQGGGLRIAAGPAEPFPESCFFDARGPGEFLQVTISDLGVGMDRAELTRIFQSDEPLVSFKEGGNGFGLSIVKQIVSEHGGALAARSEPGKGTHFYLFLPLFDAQN